MFALRLISILAVVTMTVTIVYGFMSGDFSGEGGEILALAWGRVTLVDLYVGLGLFGAWVAFREESWARTIMWWVFLVVLGNLTAAVYVAFVSMRAESPREVFLGDTR